MLITFDDGYRDILENALPVLRRHGYPAVIFVPIGYLDDARPLPHEEHLAARGARQPDARLGRARRSSRPAGSASRAHGIGHRPLADLDVDEAAREITLSKLRLEERLGRPVRAFAYVKGSEAHYRPVHLSLLKQAGYEIAFTSISGGNGPEMDPLRLHRYNVEPYAPRTFELVLAGACDLIALKDTVAGTHARRLFNQALGTSPSESSSTTRRARRLPRPAATRSRASDVAEPSSTGSSSATRPGRGCCSEVREDGRVARRARDELRPGAGRRARSGSSRFAVGARHAPGRARARDLRQARAGERGAGGRARGRRWRSGSRTRWRGRSSSGKLGWHDLYRMRLWARPLRVRRTGAGGLAARSGGYLESFDARHEELWRAEGYRNALVRSAEYLTWRYLDAPRDYRVLGDERGYAVVGHAVRKGFSAGVVCELVGPAHRLLRRCVRESKGCDIVLGRPRPGPARRLPRARASCPRPARSA